MGRSTKTATNFKNKKFWCKIRSNALEKLHLPAESVIEMCSRESNSKSLQHEGPVFMVSSFDGTEFDINMNWCPVPWCLRCVFEVNGKYRRLCLSLGLSSCSIVQTYKEVPLVSRRQGNLFRVHIDAV